MNFKKRNRALLFCSGLVLAFAASAKAGSWTPVVTDSFVRADSATVGNNWNDVSGAGSITSNTLKLLVPANGTGTDIRVSRPVSEAGLNQRIEATFVIPATNDGLAHSVYVRGKSLVIGGEEIYPVMMISARHSGVLSGYLSYKGGAGIYVNAGSGSATSFTAVAGRSYTLSLEILNNFPGMFNATLRDNTTSTQVANFLYSDTGIYAGSKTHMSPDFTTAGVVGVSMEGTAGKNVTFTNVSTYSWTESGVLTAPTAPLAYSRAGKFYVASPFPSGGTGTYSVRWYRGTSIGFTPPVKFDGSGSGTGTYLGNTFEIVDPSAPSGITNFSVVYRAVLFDSTATASTSGILSPGSNQNSPSAKDYAQPFWIGDSITYGYATSSGGYSKSPAAYAQTYLASDAAFAAAYTMPITNGFYVNYGLSGKTSGEMAARTPAIKGYTRLLGVTFAGIMLGTNDSKNSVSTLPAQYKTNIQSIVTALKAVNPDIKIVLNKPTWFKPDNGYVADFSTASLGRIDTYRAKLNELADGTNITVGGLTASDEIQAYGWTGTVGVNNPGNATMAYPPAPTGGKSYLTDGLHPYDGGAEMIAKLEWGPNAKASLFGGATPIPVVAAGADKSITLPTASVLINASATSSNSTIASYAWTKISGGSASIGSPAAASTQVTGLAQGTYVFRLTATDALGASGYDEVQVVVSASTFASWATENGLSGNDALPTADPDGNGVSNMLEYAFGIVHGSSNAAALPTVISSGGQLQITYQPLQSSLVYRAEWSDDLNTWNTSGITISTNGNSKTASLPAGSNSHLFLRLKIISP